MRLCLPVAGLLSATISSPGTAGALADGPSRAETFDGSAYLCQPLEAAFEDLERRGLRLIYSSDLVRPELQVKTVPEGAVTAGELLEALLRPHGLEAESAAGDRWLIVPGPDFETPPIVPERPVGRGPLPAWVSQDASQQSLSEIDFPANDFSAKTDPSRLSPATRYLIIRLRPEELIDAENDAFALKELIVAARSSAPRLKVALEGPRDVVEALTSFGLAPYIEAYLPSDSTESPSTDPTARSWWRTPALGSEVLARLIEGSRRGDQLVILEGEPLGPVHEAFLRRLANTLSAPLEASPTVRDFPPERAFFFLDPNRDAHFLAIYGATEGEQRLRFDLGRPVEVRSLFPWGATFTHQQWRTETELTLHGDLPYALFEIVPRRPNDLASDVTVRSEALIDPYEEVVQNQIFQRIQRDQFQSLDVMEYLSVTSSNPEADQITWEHRIIQRRGHLTDYHHLGLLRNGVRVPTDRLLKGRIFRADALLQLRPLDIELDETYRYRLLGSEEVDGHPTWKIGFEPVRPGSVEDGTFVSGVVWLDKKTRAHRRMRTVQKGLESRVLSVERTSHFGWIPDGGECFWDWRRQEGTGVSSFLGRQATFSNENLRRDFRFNRTDIEEQVRKAYSSDVLIHVETPPDGHRWLVKRGGGRELGGFTDGRQVHAPPVEVARETRGEAPVPAEPPPTTSSDYGDRVLADIHAFSRHASLSLGGFGSSGDEFELFPGIVLTDNDLFDRGYIAFAGIFRRRALLALGKPNAFSSGGRRRGVHLDLNIRLPYETQQDSLVRDTGDGARRNLNLDVWQPGLTLTAAWPLASRLSLTSAYILRQLRFDATGETDPGFALPSDTLEHGLGLDLSWRGQSFAAGLGVEAGHRADWEPWGLDGAAALEPTWSVWNARGSWFRRLPGHRSLAAELGLWKGESLDRFSRLPEGRTRSIIAGFGAAGGFDEALRLSVGHGFRAWRLPLHVRLDAGRQRVLSEADDSWRDLLGVRARFLIHGPLRLDLWPSVGYGLYSSRTGEEGDLVFGLTVERRQ